MSDLPSASFVIELEPPVEVSGGKYDRLELKEPTAAQVLRAEAELKAGVNAETARKYQLLLIALVSGIGRNVVDHLPISKVNEAMQYLEGFLSHGLGTGEN